MATVVEIVLATLAVIGLLSLGWSLFGRMVTPVGPDPVFAVIPARGGGEGLEQTVKGLLWLQGGEMTGFTVVMADAGLSEEGRQLADALCRQFERVQLCPLEELGRLMDT